MVADDAMGRPWWSSVEGDTMGSGCLRPGVGRCLSGSMETERTRVSEARGEVKCGRVYYTNRKGSQRFKSFPSA